MSDIPDWLVELAAQRDQDDTDDDEEVETALSAEPLTPTASAPDELENAPVLEDSASDDEALEEEDADVMNVLRGQVELEDDRAPAPAPARRGATGRTLAGLLPWQQLVLAILFFLDVAVIGLLFLVMLGRIAIP